MCLKSMLHKYSKEEFIMFTENIMISGITAHVKNFLSVSVRDKKKFDKKFMKAVCLYEKYENNKLIESLNELDELFENALTYVKEHDNIELELAYCELDETSILSIETFINRYINETKVRNFYKIPKLEDNLEYTKDLLKEIIRVYNLDKKDAAIYLKKVIGYLS